MPAVYVPTRLPRAWWTDPLYREEINRQIHALHAAGTSANEIARRVGVTNRTVVRFRAKNRG